MRAQPLPGANRCANGRCKRLRVGAQLMCTPCWLRVPSKLQVEVYRTWRARQSAPTDRAVIAAHEAAKAAAIQAVAE